MGPSLVTWESLLAWSAFMQIALHPWEAHALVRLGYKRAEVESEKMRNDMKRGAGSQ